MAEDVISIKSRRKQKAKARRRWKIKPRFFILLFSLLVLWVAVGFVHRHVQIAVLQAKIVRVEREIAALQIRNEAIRQQLKEMQSDAHIERVAREKLGLVKPGEIVYIPVHPARPGDPADVQKRPGTASNFASGY